LEEEEEQQVYSMRDLVFNLSSKYLSNNFNNPRVMSHLMLFQALELLLLPLEGSNSSSSLLELVLLEELHLFHHLVTMVSVLEVEQCLKWVLL
jgi:hypothetical protein